MSQNSHEHLYAYIDTNALMEFRHPRENNWCDLTSARQVTLVLTDVVINELQKIKDGGGRDYPKRKRQRAAELLKGLERDLFADTSAPEPCLTLRDGVTLIFEYASFPDSFFEDHQLDPQMGDDRLVAFLLRGRDKHSNVCLIGNDAGPRWKARARRILTFDLPQAWRLIEEPDPKDTEIKDLRRRLEQHEGRMPRLSLGFLDGTVVTRHTLPARRSMDENGIQVELAHLRRKYGLADSDEDVSYEVIVDGEARTHGGDYDARLETFLAAVAKVLPAAMSAQARADRCVPLKQLLLHNSGTAPAEAARIILRAPVDVEILDRPPAAYNGKRIRRPTRPAESEATLAMFSLQRSIRAQTNAFEIPMLRTPQWSVSASRKNAASIGLGTIRHSCSREPLPDLFLLLPAEKPFGSFSLDYEVHAYNMSEPVTGKVHCHISEGPETSELGVVDDCEPSA